MSEYMTFEYELACKNSAFSKGVFEALINKAPFVDARITSVATTKMLIEEDEEEDIDDDKAYLTVAFEYESEAQYHASKLNAEMFNALINKIPYMDVTTSAVSLGDRISEKINVVN